MTNSIIFCSGNEICHILDITKNYIEISRSNDFYIYSRFKIVKNKIWWSVFENDFSDNFKIYCHKLILNKAFI